MNDTPRLFTLSKDVSIANNVFSDLQMDKILSGPAISILKHPCNTEEILNRNELFESLKKRENQTRINNTLNSIKELERSLFLKNKADTALELFSRKTRSLELYLNACKNLAVLSDLGVLLNMVAQYYSTPEMTNLYTRLENAIDIIKEQFGIISHGSLSFSDKNWLTTDKASTSEFDTIADLALDLGFNVPKINKLNIKVSRSLCDAICDVYSDNVRIITNELSKFDDTDLYMPTSYINELSFIVEIGKLIDRAMKIGVETCIAKVSTDRRFVAKDICDVSLLAKNCEKIVANNADFNETERFCFIIGANGGGKTTHLRAIGINLILFLAGCPIFAREAEIFPFDTVMTHFPKDECFENIGRLDEEKARAEDMLNGAKAANSFLLFNETYSGTDGIKGFKLLRETVNRVSNERCFGIYVTHFREVMRLDVPIYTAHIIEGETIKRTFRIIKAEGGISSYAQDVLKRYKMDEISLKARRMDNGN